MEYIILDIETTGLDIETSSIIEVGAILIDKGVIKDEYQSFVRFADDLPLEIKRLTGITEGMVREAPALDQVITELKSFINKRPVVSHNGFRFDFLMLERAGLTFSEKHDSMEFAFFVLPTSIDGHSVQALAEYFDFGEEKHRALDDCKLEYAIVSKLAEAFTRRRKDRCESLKNVASSINWWWTAFLAGDTRPSLSVADLIDAYEPYKKRDASQERMPLEIASIEQSDVGDCFSRQGGATTESYNEERPEQKRMALVIAEAFNTKTHAVIEAGTGTGKSKAYLAPASLFAQKNSIPMVIATYTKALQDQLFNKEIPHIKEIISDELRVTLLKGKTNYVCLTKFDDYFGEIRQELFKRSLYKFGKDELRYTSQLSYLLLASWLSETERGDWDEVPYWLKKRIPKEIALEICNTDELCNTDTCDLYDSKKCFLAKARLGARDSDLIVANHALVLSGIREKLVEAEQESIDDEGGSVAKQYSNTIFPGEAKYIVFDEAHHLEDAATSAWERVISRNSTEFLLDRLYGKRSIKSYLDAVVRGSGDETLVSLYNQFVGTADKMRALARSLFSEIIPGLVPHDLASPYRTKARIDALRRAGTWGVAQHGLSDMLDSLATVMR
ncbi:MAG: exonuclease domain-containing protein, partial [Candidatus Uhrbacteria bacterium]|nr:exonuclease domain-containing protein [Candidatus Uhrbacteria bacterium]